MFAPRASVCCLLLSTSLLLVAAAGTASAQDAPDPPKPPIFGQLFGQPTGQNGYENWVQAGDLIINNDRIAQAVEGDATLIMKRRLLGEPNVQAALHLLHVGLNKPVQPPRAMIDAATTFPEFSVFRKLARLLSIEMYVQFADGRIDMALDTLDDGLRFGYRMQNSILISGLVGIAIDAMILKSFSAHLDQLSEYQCLRVRRMVEEMAAWPSPLTFLLRIEQQMTARTLDQLGADPKATQDIIEILGDEDEWDKNTRRLAAHLRSNPPDVGVLVALTKARAAAYYDAAIVNVQRPRSQRKTLPSVGGDTLDARLLDILTPFIDQVADKYDQMEAKVRLLGVHAAVRAYRWEHNRLPPTLADLHIGKLTLDPFTGNALRYHNNGTTYDLFSSGSSPLDDDGKPTNAPPIPVRL